MLIRLVIKVQLLFFALLAILFSQGYLNANGLPDSVKSMFGMATPKPVKTIRATRATD